MPTPIYLVKVGMTMTEGTVEEWYVDDGGEVTTGDLLYRLETEKVNLDVDAEASGTVKHGVAIGVTLEPGDIVGYIFAAGEDIVLPDGAASPTPSQPGAPPVTPTPSTGVPTTVDGRVRSSPAARRRARELGIDFATLDGTGPGGRIVEADIENAANDRPSHRSTETVAPATPPPKASPLARRLAAERSVDLRRVAGTGPGGRITKEDVEQAAAAPAVAERPSSDPATPPGRLSSRRIPLKGMRKVIAERMHASLMTSAQLTMDMDIAMDDAVKLREQLLDEWADEGIRPTYTDLVLRAVAKALGKHPLMNSTLTDTEIVLIEEVHVGVAVAVPDGLVVPVIRDADRRSLRDVAIESNRLAAAARDGTLGLDDYAGGTFTISALGMYGVDSFTPIINQPQAGILGVNRLRDDVGFDGDSPVRRKFMRLSLTWDHRVLDGAPAAEFLGEVRDLLQAPYRLLV